MNLLFVVIPSAVFLCVAYVTYGRFLAGLLKLDPKVVTPAVELRDDVDYVPIESKFLLSQHFSAIAAAGPIVGPILAGVMFGKLARAVLNLDSDRRNNLLQRAILPGLLDGDANGKVLRDFPDMDLAESICLLLDLETAAPEVLSAALNRLDVSTERRAALVPLIEERMRTTRGGGTNDISLGSSGVERHARELIRIDTNRETDFSEFAAFDLSMDAQAELAVLEVPLGRRNLDLAGAEHGLFGAQRTGGVQPQLLLGLQRAALGQQVALAGPQVDAL